MRRAARRDANHGAVVEALRAAGAAVKDVAGTPGLLDLLVGYRGRLYWIEVKDGAKAPSRRRLTAREVETFEQFARVGCEPLKVETPDDALRAIGAL